MNHLDVLRAHTAQYAAELGPDDEPLPHTPINADAAAELISKWSSGSVGNPSRNPADERTWDALQMIADDHKLPIDELLGAIWFVAQHNGAYKHVPDEQDQIGCAVGEILRVLGTFDQLIDGKEEK